MLVIFKQIGKKNSSSDKQSIKYDKRTQTIYRAASNYRKRYIALEELLEFAAESGKLENPCLATDVKKLKKVLFYTPPEKLSIEELCNAEAELEKYYSMLSEWVYPVTILTLRTTSDNYPIYRSWWQSIFLGAVSEGRIFFRKLIWLGLLLLVLIFLRQYTLTAEATIGNTLLTSIDPIWQNLLIDLLKFIDPFLYGALGALVFIYKDLNRRYIDRTLHPKKLTTNWLRLFMGCLAGGLIVNLLTPFFANMMQSSHIPSVVVGFLAGYSVDFFYKTLDLSIRAIIPSKTQAQISSNQRQVQIEFLTKSLKEMTNEEDKALIRRLLEKV
jgi:hypothetical protein